MRTNSPVTISIGDFAWTIKATGTFSLWMLEDWHKELVAKNCTFEAQPTSCEWFAVVYHNPPMLGGSSSMNLCSFPGHVVRAFPDDMVPLMIRDAYWKLKDEPGHTCVLCKEWEIPHFDSKANERLKNQRLCFHCDFWLERSRHYHDPQSAVIGGRAYFIGKEDVPDGLKGFNGCQLTIKFNDGRVVTTTNLWTQGEIPVGFNAMMPDNAVFVTEGGRHE